MSDIDLAVKQLQSGQVVGFPTETVYGLGADITQPAAVQKIFSTKKRPFFDPLIVHVDSIAMAKTCFKAWGPVADVLARKFWPGPLTLVMPKSDMISDVITSGLENVGVRIPQHPMAIELIQKLGRPVAAPSANRFGKTSPTQAQHVRTEFNNEVMVLDGGSSQVGIESTVLLIQNDNQLSILRPGAITTSQIESELKQQSCDFIWSDTADKKNSPGQMKHHYMPEVPLVICRNSKMTISEMLKIVNEKLPQLPSEIEGVQIIKPTSEIKKIEFLKLPKDATQAARELYSTLRAASERKPDVLCYIQIPETTTSDLWESIFDRMNKAASLIID